MKKFITCTLTILLLGGCSGVSVSSWHFPYMMEVQQGNYITENQYKQLKLGMTKDQVAFILDRPLTQFMFDQNRWDYIFQDYKNNSLKKSYSLSIIFDKTNKVVDIKKTGDFENEK